MSECMIYSKKKCALAEQVRDCRIIPRVSALVCGEAGLYRHTPDQDQITASGTDQGASELSAKLSWGYCPYLDSQPYLPIHF